MIVLLSGGLDSTVLLARTLDTGQRADAISIAYGQRHRRELDAAAAVAAHYQVRHDVIDLTGLGPLLSGSALTDPTVDVPYGHYAAPSMRATVVPNRNMIFLAVAAGIAAARGHASVATAVHAGDHPIYPDCRPTFITAASLATQLGTAGHGDITIDAPFAHWTKTQIAAEGHRLHAPLALSWSCYEDGPVHCGRCGTCCERQEAFRDAGIPDPTTYAELEPAP